MSAEYSVEEVLSRAAAVRCGDHDLTADMLTAYAERIKADESAVPVAQLRLRLDRWDVVGIHIRAIEKLHLPAGEYPLFVHPPAQAAQAFALPKSFVDRATSSDESEPQVMGAGHLVQFTTAQVDWLMTFNARLIVNGLHPEDARMWMRATDQWDFDADPVAESDSTWQDFFANPDDDGPFDPTPTAEPAAQGEAVVSALAVDRACLAYDNATTEVADYPSETGMRAALEDFLAAQPRAVLDGLQSIVREAAEVLQMVVDSGVPLPPNWRGPLADELSGFAYMLTDAAAPSAPAGVPDGVRTGSKGRFITDQGYVFCAEVVDVLLSILKEDGEFVIIDRDEFMTESEYVLAAAPSAPEEKS